MDEEQEVVEAGMIDPEEEDWDDETSDDDEDNWNLILSSLPPLTVIWTK